MQRIDLYKFLYYKKYKFLDYFYFYPVFFLVNCTFIIVNHFLNFNRNITLLPILTETSR